MENIQTIRLNKFRQRIVISLLGFIFVNNRLYYTGELLGYVTILEEKIKVRVLYFNEFYYMSEWGDWKFMYKLVKIL